jgi:hypothetical protein
MNRHSWPASRKTARIGRILSAGDVTIALEEILDDIKREIAALRCRPAPRNPVAARDREPV